MAKERRYEEYAKYATSQDEFSSTPFRVEAVEEFKQSLHPNSLNVDDVGGIRNLTESAHIGRNISSGPYKSFHHGTSAIEVTTVVHEQFNALDNMRRKGELNDGIPLMDSELKRRGFYTDGVKGAIQSAWDQHMTAEKHYSEVFSDCSAACLRSDLTTEASLQLYTSLYPPDQPVPMNDLIFVTGKKPIENEKRVLATRAERSNRSQREGAAASFVEKAARAGIPITAHQDRVGSKGEPLFRFKREGDIPVGFEMINEGLFALKKNKFMVFNGAGVDSWRLDTTPATKTKGMEYMLLGTLK